VDATTSGRPFSPATTERHVASVRRIADKNLRDLPRVLEEAPAAPTALTETLAGVDRLRLSADRLKAVLKSRDHDHTLRPAEIPGTYVTLYRLSKAAKGVRVGQLGTFDFPVGYYCYVGSAFGGGGVFERTGRHLTAGGPKR
jgi:hypothetical protein